MDFRNITQHVQPKLLEMESLLKQSLESDIQIARQLIEYITKNPGKRIRPLLVLLSAKAFGSDKGKRDITLAALVELLHSASLLHDDVVDSAPLRRGLKSANVIWGNKASILVGDFLLAKALNLLSSLHTLLNNQTPTKFISQALNAMVEGELLQLKNNKNLGLDEITYLNILEKKTGKLFELSAIAGPILMNTHDSEVTSMIEYGKYLGIAFQLVDDAMDYQGNKKVIGKSTGNDFIDGKMTMPLIYALQQAPPKQKLVLRKLILQKNKKAFKTVQSMIDELQAVDYTAQLANEYANKAIDALNNLPLSISKDYLIALAKFAVERTI